ncbi:MAG: aminopeptidase [Candidatus Desulfovibrio kirbyi]|jgi:aspartyl aminopeptidase|uniref:M18 family aminopeptidase n=1 Tax=Candidatus Desulfovibrio kirbyi TaxID=2696086 RepID=A0A6L2R436_9BACT|nr:aminopeptidase [Desulfovibrio sp.]GFH62340.1 MAG: aminopeptidase [Candidatus Desulfovibrio kirbyi]
MQKPLAYTPKNVWETLTRREEVDALATRYIDFLSRCKTERETVAYVCECLAKAGFSEDFTKKSVFRSLRGKTVFAARRGRNPLSDGFALIAAHVDTPRLDFKQRPLIEQPGVVQAKTHYYGGIRKYQWLARPLALHGVIVRENGEKLPVTLGEKPDEPVFCIADLLPHLAQKQGAQTINDAFEGEKLNLVLAHSPAPDTKTKGKADKKTEPVKDHLLILLHKQYGITEEDLITAEVQAVPAGPARFAGFDRSLVGGYGQDDRICVFTALEALLNAKSAGRNMAVIFWDKEEIGSDGATGATSRFFQYCVEDLSRTWGRKASTAQIFLATQAISADVQGALDPDFQDLHEKQNAALLGYGPCFSKFTGSRGKYGASEADAEFFASLRGLLNAKSIPWQTAELGKVDAGGGGTVALHLAAYGMQVIDFGPALLSMHSPFELASCADLWATLAAYRAFFED